MFLVFTTEISKCNAYIAEFKVHLIIFHSVFRSGAIIYFKIYICLSISNGVKKRKFLGNLGEAVHLSLLEIDG